jgi:hypothetical protein
MTPARYRRRPHQRWRAAHLHHTRATEPGVYVAELTDRRTGGARTLTTGHWQIHVRHHGHWTPLAAWATTTPELFTHPST